MDRGAWQLQSMGSQSQTQLSDFHFFTSTSASDLQGDHVLYHFASTQCLAPSWAEHDYFFAHCSFIRNCK